MQAVGFDDGVILVFKNKTSGVEISATETSVAETCGCLFGNRHIDVLSFKSY